MAWQNKTLALPKRAKKALLDNLKGRKTAFSLSISGLKIGMHNWTHGIEEESNFYLSPTNAIKALQAKFSDYQDTNRPSGICDVVVFLISANNETDFIFKLEKTMAVLPDPIFKQALDYAKAHKELAQTKMIKTPPLAHPAFGKTADITPQTGRELNSIMRNVQALNQEQSDSAKIIEQLKAQQAKKQQAQQEKINSMLNSAVEIEAFSETGLLDAISFSLMQNLANKDHSFTALLCFIGQNLTQLKEMLSDNI